MNNIEYFERLFNTMCVEDWAILGLETVLAGVLTEHPAVS